jgi:peptidoglycan/LPS O-acetylase OafA/YrhL
MGGFRHEIDGLRAVAVLVVILFHADFSWAQGGYVGVDVFFVISGFLITLGLIKSGASTSLASFYARRVRRLFPALLATVILTIIASFFVMRGQDFAEVSKSAIYALISISNIGFWLESGYWDSASHYKPLLHTWSLSVEEQFYLIWPVMVLLIARLGKVMLLVFMLVLGIVGGLIAQYYSTTIPSAVFYLTPFRVYQFAMGASYAVLITILGRDHLIKTPIVRDILAFAGLALVIWPTLTFNGEDTGFLGMMAAIPCLGGLLIIVAGPGPVIGRLLINPVAGFLGRISYSLYLVHWPIMSLYRYYIARDFHLYEQIAMIFATILLAWLLYILVEKRFRRPIERQGKKTLSAAGFGLICAGMTIAAIVVSAHGWAIRPQPAINTASAEPATGPLSLRALSEVDNKTWWAQRRQDIPQECRGKRRINCLKPQDGQKTVIILGDSQGNEANIMMTQIEPNQFYIPAFGHFFGEGCITMYAPDRPETKRQASCINFQETVYGQTPLVAKADVIILAYRYDALKIDFIEPTVKRIREVNPNAPIVLLGEAFRLTERIQDIIRVLSYPDNNPIIPMEYFASDFDEVAVYLKGLSAKYDLTYIDRHGFFCPNRACRMVTLDGQSLTTTDTNHLSAMAAIELGRHLSAEGTFDALVGP